MCQKHTYVCAHELIAKEISFMEPFKQLLHISDSVSNLFYQVLSPEKVIGTLLFLGHVSRTGESSAAGKTYRKLYH